MIDSSGTPAYAHRCDRAVVAASTQKIIVAAAALRYLGAAYRFHTQLASVEPITAGALPSDLWLVGSGDPVLTSEDLRGGVKIFGRTGVQSIGGVVRVDASALSGPERNPLWDPADANSGFAAATSGISLDQDTIEFHVHPSAPGTPARIELKPRSSIVTYSGTVLTVPAGYSSYVTINPTASQNVFVVQGKIAASEGEAIYYLPVSRIPNYAGDVLESMLEERNIATRGRSGTGIAPAGMHVFWDHRSPPMRFIVSKMLYESNNHIAEQLLRKIGHAQGGTGDDAHGAAAEYAYLRSTGVPVPLLRLVDGSGLADSNRVAAVTLATLLARAELTPGGNQLYLALPRGGIEGTLRHYRFSTALGRVRA
ncbi:MAG: D-alanyl-D-alanine carboxypeptidase/D-alanyl-D-alanine-endopeptidase, partial [Candidatus Eremiobacteraeota bacterium]|nr:D-alanyl-D-alanine carboxypeptidase/D-alanyl-D-alanine-endopeptidase [Candidatus Eremiobacteraeota bacterium]